MILPCGCRVETRPDTHSVVCTHQAWRVDELPPAIVRLGDRIDRLLSHIGGRQFKRLYRRLFGRDCGCDGRRRWLNRIARKPTISTSTPP